MAIFQQEGGEQRIKDTALALLGMTGTPDTLDVLYRCALHSSLALCGREDVPQAMEQAVAFVLARLLQEGDGRPVLSVRRGDVAITYDKKGYQQMREQLAPFIRLRQPQ